MATQLTTVNKHTGGWVWVWAWVSGWGEVWVWGGCLPSFPNHSLFPFPATEASNAASEGANDNENKDAEDGNQDSDDNAVH